MNVNAKCRWQNVGIKIPGFSTHNVWEAWSHHTKWTLIVFVVLLLLSHIGRKQHRRDNVTVLKCMTIIHKIWCSLCERSFDASIWALILSRTLISIIYYNLIKYLRNRMNMLQTVLWEILTAIKKIKRCLAIFRSNWLNRSPYHMHQFYGEKQTTSVLSNSTLPFVLPVGFFANGILSIKYTRLLIFNLSRH